MVVTESQDGEVPKFPIISASASPKVKDQRLLVHSRWEIRNYNNIFFLDSFISDQDAAP